MNKTVSCFDVVLLFLIQAFMAYYSWMDQINTVTFEFFLFICLVFYESSVPLTVSSPTHQFNNGQVVVRSRIWITETVLKKMPGHYNVF